MNNLRIIDADGHVQERDANWQELSRPTLSQTCAEHGAVRRWPDAFIAGG